MASPSIPEPDRSPVVAFVGSAGSIEALRTVLAELDGRLDVPIVVLVHQSPDRPDDALKTALGRFAATDVREAQTGWSLRPGQILVVPAGTHLLVHPGRRIQLIPAGDPPPYRPSADLLLTTMAIALGAAVIAVVLSGGGKDGATGATAVHDNGGTVLTTDEETSRTFSMPQATIRRDGIEPDVVPVGELARRLIDLVDAAQQV